MTHAFVYLLRHAEEPRFKIGHSIDPEGRIYELCEPVTAERSMKIRFPQSEARAAERVLHFMFRAHRLEGVQPEGGVNAGWTEWFCESAFDEVLAFLIANRDRMAWLTIEPLGAFKMKTRKPRPRPIVFDPDGLGPRSWGDYDESRLRPRPRPRSRPHLRVAK